MVSGRESTYQKLPKIDIDSLTPMDKNKIIKNLKREMYLAAQDLNFELAAENKLKPPDRAGLLTEFSLKKFITNLTQLYS